MEDIEQIFSVPPAPVQDILMVSPLFSGPKNFIPNTYPKLIIYFCLIVRYLLLVALVAH